MPFTYTERATKATDPAFLARLDIGMRLAARNILNDPAQSARHAGAAQILNGDAPRADGWCPPVVRRVALAILSREDVPESSVNNVTAVADTALQPFIDAAVSEVANG